MQNYLQVSICTKSNGYMHSDQDRAVRMAISHGYRYEPTIAFDYVAVFYAKKKQKDILSQCRA